VRPAAIFEIGWDMENTCVLRTSDHFLQALGEVVERPAGFCFADEMLVLYVVGTCCSFA
jgi:hypothetical protein